MGIYEDLNNYFLKLAEEVNEAILNDEFEILSIDEHTSKIECCGAVFRIWTANDPTYCRVYTVETKGYDHLPVYLPDHKFKQPETCRKKVTTPKGKLLEKIKKDKEEQIKKLEQEISKLKS